MDSPLPTTRDVLRVLAAQYTSFAQTHPNELLSVAGGYLGVPGHANTSE